MSEKVKMYQNKIRVDSPQAVQRLLGRTINLLLDDQISTEKSKAIGYLSNILLSCFQTVDMEQRLTELEEIVKNDSESA